MPLTPEELAREARASVAAGAGALHLHPRDAGGRESLDPEVVAPALTAVRAACPGVPLGISSGFWILPEVAGQLAAARAFLDWPGRDGVLRVLVELPDRPAEEVRPEAERILALLDAAAVPAPRLLHGQDRSAWPLLGEAARRGLQARIGLEDTLVLPDGTPAAGNADLVRTARRVLASAG